MVTRAPEGLTKSIEPKCLGTRPRDSTDPVSLVATCTSETAGDSLAACRGLARTTINPLSSSITIASSLIIAACRGPLVSNHGCHSSGLEAGHEVARGRRAALGSECLSAMINDAAASKPFQQHIVLLGLGSDVAPPLTQTQNGLPVGQTYIQSLEVIIAFGYVTG